MIAPEVLEAMKAAGASVDVIIAAINADNALAAKAVDKRRAKDAERQRRHRMSRGQGVTNSDTPSPLVPPKVSPGPLSNNPPIIPQPSETPNGVSSDSEISPEDFVEAWNVMAKDCGLPQAKVTPERRRKIGTLVRRRPIDEIREAIWSIPRSEFLCGSGSRGWRANIDFILQPSSFQKLIEGTYDKQTA